MEKVLTIVIPTYNMEDLLRRCLDSLIIEDQKILNRLEVLIVNDGSKDSSSLIAHEYEGEYPAIFRVIDKENGNYGSCINRGLKEASGKYIKILDADDTYNTDSLSRFIDFLCRKDDDIVFSPYNVLDYNSNLVESFGCPEKLLYGSLSIDAIDWQAPDIVKFRAMHAMATKTKILLDNDYYQTEGISYTDTQFVFFSDLYAKTCSFFKEPIYNYYLGRDGQTMSLASKQKSCMHFYQNAVRLLDSFSSYEYKTAVSSNRLNLLADSVFAEINFFYGTVIGGFADISQYIPSINELYSKGCGEDWRGVLMKKMDSHPTFRLYNGLHIPNSLLYHYYQFKYKIARFIKH